MEKMILEPYFIPKGVNCAWCDKGISPRAACCPYCGHPGPGLEWKNNPKKISFKITPQVPNKWWTFYIKLFAEWSVLNGKVIGAEYSTAFYSTDSFKDYLLEIEVPPNAHVSVSAKIDIPGSGDDFGETLYLLPTDEQKTVISEPGIYEIVLYKVPKIIWFKTKFEDAFTINRIG